MEIPLSVKEKEQRIARYYEMKRNEDKFKTTIIKRKMNFIIKDTKFKGNRSIYI